MKALLVAAAVGAAACGGATDPGIDAHVRFVTDARVCSDPHPVNFFIDNVQVGRDTLWFGLDPDSSPVPPPAGATRFKSYATFSVHAGIHTVHATMVDTVTHSSPPFVYNWPDTTVSVAAGAEVVRKLSFYCS